MAQMGLGQKSRAWRALIMFQNGESSASFAVGNAAVLLASDPSKVVRSPTAGAAQTPALLAGVAVRAAAPGEPLNVIVAGYAPTVGVQLMTRAASTDAWASYAGIATGDYFTAETVNGLFMRSGAGAALAAAYQVVALQSVASFTTQASSVGGSATVLSTTIGAWLRCLV